MSRKLTHAENRGHDPETWMNLYGELLYRFALFRVQDSEAAEDLVQETFLAALGAYKSFRGQSTMRTWLIAILKHKSVDHIRKKIKERGNDDTASWANVADRNVYDDEEYQTRYCHWSNSPLNLYAYKELMDTVHQCLATLPGRPAEAFILREFEGLSTQEICEALNITSANCWVMLHRARRRLRACIESRLLEAGV